MGDRDVNERPTRSRLPRSWPLPVRYMTKGIQLWWIMPGDSMSMSPLCPVYLSCLINSVIASRARFGHVDSMLMLPRSTSVMSTSGMSISTRSTSGSWRCSSWFCPSVLSTQRREWVRPCSGKGKPLAGSYVHLSDVHFRDVHFNEVHLEVVRFAVLVIVLSFRYDVANRCEHPVKDRSESRDLRPLQRGPLQGRPLQRGPFEGIGCVCHGVVLSMLSFETVA